VSAKRVEKKKANGHVIANEGRKVARNRHIDSAKAVHDAMKKIEDDAQANGGIYPLNNGVISIQELLRRAEKGAGYLEKKTDRIIALKKDVTKWIASINSKVVRGAKFIRHTVTERVDDANEEVREIRQAWTEAELKYWVTQDKLKAAQATIADLQKQNASLLAQNSGTKDVSIAARKNPT
jgi:hypothetical protein